MLSFSDSHPWPLHAAKARFSELFRRVFDQGPQWVTRAGKETVVVISAHEFKKLTERQHHGLAEFIASSPLAGIDLPLTRDQSPDRSIDL